MILLVDDEEDIRIITTRTLESFGYVVLVAKDGQEGLRTFTQYQGDIALVFTGMMMPNMDGLALIASLKALKPDVKIIAASGAQAETQRAKSSAAWVEHFLSKPYTAKAMLTALNEVLHSPHHPISRV